MQQALCSVFSGMDIALVLVLMAVILTGVFLIFCGVHKAARIIGATG